MVGFSIGVQSVPLFGVEGGVRSRWDCVSISVSVVSSVSHACPFDF